MATRRDDVWTTIGEDVEVYPGLNVSAAFLTADPSVTVVTWVKNPEGRNPRRAGCNPEHVEDACKATLAKHAEVSAYLEALGDTVEAEVKQASPEVGAALDALKQAGISGPNTARIARLLRQDLGDDAE